MYRFLKALLLVVALFIVASVVFRQIWGVPDFAYETNDTALPPSFETPLGQLVLPLVDANPDKSGVVPLRDGYNAYAARVVLADAAQDSIDLQYYIWQKDITGLLLLEAIREAADRGVRVRMLLDDNGTPDLDPELAEMDAHPNIEIRLFNPFVLRSPRILSFVLDFRRLNRRMHNKSFTVDGIATVVGGRNVGDIYFSRNEEVNYFDLDVVALGDAAQDVSTDFDLYWDSPSSVPAAVILPPRPADGGVLSRSVAAVRAAPGGQAFDDAARNSGLMRNLETADQSFDWVEMSLVSDDPAKGQGKVEQESLLIGRLLTLLGRPQQAVDLVSAYFVPGDRLTKVLSDWAKEGITVRTLTNAQESTDVLPVHSGYRLYRDELVNAGVEVYELRRTHEAQNILEQFGLIGSTNTSLHAKTFVIDRSQVFVGSFNFDPRSARLNTEMGFLIESPRLAAQMAAGYDRYLPSWTYRVMRGGNGGLRWTTMQPDGEVEYTTEPGTNALSRFVVRFVGWLPVQWML